MDEIHKLRPGKKWHLKPFRKPKNGNLTEEQEHFNNVITEFRGDIERKFGELVNRFGIIKEAYRHDEHTYNFEFKLCMFY